MKPALEHDVGVEHAVRVSLHVGGAFKISQQEELVRCLRGSQLGSGHASLGISHTVSISVADPGHSTRCPISYMISPNPVHGTHSLWI
jgi:hypothetical protein